MHDQATEPRSRKLIAGASLAVAVALGFSTIGTSAATAAEPAPPSQNMSYDSTADVESGDVALADAQNMFNDFMANGGGDLAKQAESALNDFIAGSSNGSNSDLLKDAENAFNELTKGGNGEDLLAQLNGFLGQFDLPADPMQIIENAPDDVLTDPNKFAKYLEEEVGIDVNHFLDTVGNTSVVADNSQVDDGKESRNGAGLTLVDDQQVTDRLHTLTFESDELSDLQPKVNVLLPSGYDPNSDTEYPTIYLMHGGAGSYKEFMDRKVDQMVDDVIVVMPEGGIGGWYNDAEASTVGDRNWETFHTEQLLPYIDATYNTINQASARGIAGFSMGGFGSLKYTAKNPDLFNAVTSFSGPADIRDRLGAVTHWANASGVVDNGSVSGMYGAPWNEEKVSADNPIENIEQYRGKRVHFYSGDTSDITEATVRAGHVKFDKALTDAGIEHSFTPFNGPHHVPQDSLRAEMSGMAEYLDSPGTYDDPEVTLSTGEKPSEDKDSDKSSDAGSSDDKTADSDKSKDSADKPKSEDTKGSEKSKDDSSNVSDKGDDKDKAADSDKSKDSEKDADKAADSDKSKDADKSKSDDKQDDAAAETAEKWTNFFDSVLS